MNEELQIIKNKEKEEINAIRQKYKLLIKECRDKYKITKKYIPKTVKNIVWDKYIGNIYGVGNCYCCKKEIDSKHFEAGHIIAEANGGPTNVDNLRPICSCCNKTIGTKNMDNFISQYITSVHVSVHAHVHVPIVKYGYVGEYDYFTNGSNELNLLNKINELLHVIYISHSKNCDNKIHPITKNPNEYCIYQKEIIETTPYKPSELTELSDEKYLIGKVYGKSPLDVINYSSTIITILYVSNCMNIYLLRGRVSSFFDKELTIEKFKACKLNINKPFITTAVQDIGGTVIMSNDDIDLIKKSDGNLNIIGNIRKKYYEKN
jgi:hypothetical protein